MKIRTQSNRALAAVGLLIFVSAVLVIAGTIIYMLLKLCRRCLPSEPPPAGTNQVAYVEEIIPMPALIVELPSFAAPSEMVEWMTELQRSTNLVDWQPILTVEGIVPLSMNADTNPPPNAAFYRLHYFRK